MQERIIAYAAALRATSSHARTLPVDNDCTESHAFRPTRPESGIDHRVRDHGDHRWADLLGDSTRLAVDRPVGGDSRCSATGRRRRCAGRRTDPVVVSMLVLAVMFVVASVTAARRSQASRGSALLTVSLALGLVAVLPLLLLSGVVPLTGVAVVPIVAIVLGNTMTAVAVAARLALDTLKLRAGEVEAALSLGMSERDSRMEIIGESATNALLPNLDSTRTVGLVTLPGAFVGVLLSTGSATQAGAVQILV
jgi:ABC-type uncharacterized transport system, permease component